MKANLISVSMENRCVPSNWVSDKVVSSHSDAYQNFISPLDCDLNPHCCIKSTGHIPGTFLARSTAGMYGIVEQITNGACPQYLKITSRLHSFKGGKVQAYL